MRKSVVVIGFIGAVIIAVGCNQKPKEEASLMQEIAYENETIMNTETNSTAPATGTDAVSLAAPADNSMASVSVSSNPTNKDIQQALKNAGVYEGKVDGSIGPRSKKAIRDFQAQNDLKADGKVGPKTWIKLGQYLNKPSIDASAADSSTVASAQPQTIVGE
jgi:peptidoglycan hydrolase-like protein with peptidoglycan-binding domain